VDLHLHRVHFLVSHIITMHRLTFDNNVLDNIPDPGYDQDWLIQISCRLLYYCWTHVLYRVPFLFSVFLLLRSTLTVCVYVEIQSSCDSKQLVVKSVWIISESTWSPSCVLIWFVYWLQDRKGACPGLFTGPKVERVGFLGRDSNLSPPARGFGELWARPAGFGAEPRPPKGFPLFSAPRMTSPVTIILLIVDYHAGIGGKTPVPPCVRSCTSEIN